MRKKSLLFRLIVACASVSFAAVAAFIIIIERGGLDGAPLPLLGIYGGSFCLLAILLVGASARSFDVDFRGLATDSPDYEKALAKLGGTPLVSLIRMVLLLAVFLGGMALLRNRLGIPREIAGPLYLMLLPTGMLAASFIFVLSDRLVLAVLLGQGIDRYPRSLREARQVRKSFIIPLFIALMSLLFAFSRSLLVASRAPEGATMAYYAAGVFLPAILFFAIVIVLMLIWTKNTSALFQSVLEQLDSLSSGDRDLRGRIRVGSVDEIASIAGMVNSFCDGLAEGLRGLDRLHAELSELQQRLFTSIGASSAAATDIGESVGRAIDSIRREDEALRAIRTDAGNLASLSSDLAGKARDQASRIDASSQGVQTVIGSVDRLADDAGAAKASATRLADSVRAGEEALRAVTAAVEAVSTRGVDLQAINRLIANVASKTNLLAMNAAIEAAHAGTAGSGFSVVAQEIRVLAESTAEHTKRNKESLQEILGLIGQVIQASSRAGAAFADINEATQRVGEVSGSLARDLAEEGERNREILGLLGETAALGTGVAETARSLDGIAAAMAGRIGEAADHAMEALRSSETLRERNAGLARAVQESEAFAARTAALDSSLASFIKSFRT